MLIALLIGKWDEFLRELIDRKILNAKALVWYFAKALRHSCPQFFHTVIGLDLNDKLHPVSRVLLVEELSEIL